MNGTHPLSLGCRLLKPAIPAMLALALTFPWLATPAQAQPNPATKRTPDPAQGTVSPSGKFTPAHLSPATNGLPARTPAEAEAALRQALNVQWLGSNSFRLGRVEFDKEQRTVTLPARICIRTQVVEYALVTQQGKTYESLLTTEARPTDIHLAFLLLGVSPVQVGGEFRTGAPVPDANSLRIQVTWEADGRPASYPLSELISLSDERQPQSPRALVLDRWLYNGSVFGEAGFAAQTEGSIISLIRDPAALVNNPAADRDNDQIHFPNQGLLPAEGSPVRVILYLPQLGATPRSSARPGVTPITPLSTNRP